MSLYNFPVALRVRTFQVTWTVLSRMRIPCGFPVATCPPMSWLEAALGVLGDDRSGIARVVIAITCDVYFGQSV